MIAEVIGAKAKELKQLMKARKEAVLYAPKPAGKFVTDFTQAGFKVFKDLEKLADYIASVHE